MPSINTAHILHWKCFESDQTSPVITFHCICHFAIGHSLLQLAIRKTGMAWACQILSWVCHSPYAVLVARMDMFSSACRISSLQINNNSIISISTACDQSCHYYDLFKAKSQSLTFTDVNRFITYTLTYMSWEMHMTYSTFLCFFCIFVLYSTSIWFQDIR